MSTEGGTIVEAQQSSSPRWDNRQAHVVNRQSLSNNKEAKTIVHECQISGKYCLFKLKIQKSFEYKLKYSNN